MYVRRIVLRVFLAPIGECSISHGMRLPVVYEKPSYNQEPVQRASIAFNGMTEMFRYRQTQPLLEDERWKLFYHGSDEQVFKAHKGHLVN